MMKTLQFLYTAIALLCVQVVSSQIQRIEPPFWWSGMEHSSLELMVYGPDIAKLEPTVEGFDILEVKRTENPNYLFITLETKDKAPQEFELVFSKNGRKKYTQTYELKSRREGSAQRKGFDASDMVYLVMPDRFANGDPSNDSHKSVVEKVDRTQNGGRHGGDIQGIIDHLDYIQSLGATALWSTPINEDNDSTYSYHTYAQSDVYKIDPRFGTNEQYKALGEALHQRSMKLIMDYVVNHWGITHWMMEDLPTYDWIHQFPGYGQTNYRMETQMDPNASAIDAYYCMDGWFVSSMPDLNQQNPLVLNYLIQNAIWWIEYADLDGFRVDTYSYNDKEGVAKWTKAIMDEYPNFNIVGEIWMHDQAQIAYWQKDSKLAEIQDYNSHLPTVMDFTLHDAISAAFSEEAGWDTGMMRVYGNFVNDFLYPDINNILVFAENHDTARVNHLYKSLEDYRLIMTLLGTVRGIPQLYYGSEIGMAGDKSQGDGDIRRDFPGGWPGDTQNAFTKEGRTQTQQAYYEVTSKIFNWRKTATAIHNGKTTHYLPENEVYVYFRENDSQKIMVVLNNSSEAQELDLKRFQENIQQSTKGREVLSDREFSLEDKLSIGPKDSYIIEVLP